MDESSEKSFSVTAPQIAIPKGGGAIRGIGEKFSANPVTGTGSMTVPIFTSPGRSGFGPQLALSYDSGAANDVFGLGWRLSIPSITRKTDKGLPRYNVRRYRPRVEWLFARIERWTNGSYPILVRELES